MTGFLTLRISGLGLCLDNITNKLEIKPTYTYKKGDTYYDKYTNSTIVYMEDCWMTDKEIETNNPENEMLCFILLLTDKAGYIRELARGFEVILWLSLYPESEKNNVHLPYNIIEAIYKLGISMDIEVTDLREFYDGKYPLA